MYTINIWPVLISAIVGFGIGALWYSPFLFGKEWVRLMKVTDADVDSAKLRGMWKPYLAHILSNIVMYSVLGFFIAATSAISSTDGAFLGLIAWLGFIVPIGISNLLWKKEPFKLVLIDSIHLLLGMVIGGAIIGAWK